MKTFTIDAENNITAHGSRTAASKTGHGVFSTEEQLAGVIGNNGKRLVEIWNSLTGVKPVTKFTSSKVAVKRIFAALQTLEPEASPAVEPDEETAAPAAKAKAPRKAKADKSDKSPKAERAESKKDIVIGMLRRPEGATPEQIAEVTGWQAHTIRGFMAGAMKKAGLAVTSTKTADGQRVYSL